jgi:hypothetical protein
VNSCSSVDGDKPRSVSYAGMLFSSEHGVQNRTLINANYQSRRYGRENNTNIGTTFLLSGL